MQSIFVESTKVDILQFNAVGLEKIQRLDPQVVHVDEFHLTYILQTWNMGKLAYEFEKFNLDTQKTSSQVSWFLKIGFRM